MDGLCMKIDFRLPHQGVSYEVTNWDLLSVCGPRVFSMTGAELRAEIAARRGRIIWRAIADNLVTTDGANKLIDACFVGGLASPLWYGLVMQGGSPPAFVIADTMASHAFTEVTSAMIVQTARQQWIPGAIASGQVSNASSLMTYTIAPSQSPTLQGLALTDSPTLGGATGRLFGEALFGTGPQTTSGGNVINIKATIQVVAG